MTRGQCLATIQNCIWDSKGNFVPAQKNIEAAIDAYAASELAAKDAEISALRDGLQGMHDQLRDALVHGLNKDAEIAELKAENANAQELISHHVKIKRELRAEIKRLRDVVNRAKAYCEYGNGCGGATRLPNGKWFDEGDGTLYHAVLSALTPSDGEPTEPLTDWEKIWNAVNPDDKIVPKPIDAPAQEILCPKCNSHRLEKIGIGINAGTVFKCMECQNEWENEPVDFEAPAPEVVWDRNTLYINDYFIGHMYSNGHFSYGKVLGLGWEIDDDTSEQERIAKAEALGLKWYLAHKDEIV